MGTNDLHDLPDRISAAVLHLTQRCGVDQTEIARACCTTQSTVSRMKTEGRVPDALLYLMFARLARLHGYYGLPLGLLPSEIVVPVPPDIRSDGSYAAELRADTVAEGHYVEAFDRGDFAVAELAAREMIAAGHAFLAEVEYRRRAEARVDAEHRAARTRPAADRAAHRLGARHRPMRASAAAR